MSRVSAAKAIERLSRIVGARNVLLTHAGSISAQNAKENAETEFEKYRIVQDRLFESDFDRFLKEIGELALEE